jgi:hypothetical protein
MAARNNHLKFFFMMDDFGTSVGYIPMGREKMIKVTNLLLADKFKWRSVGIENLIGHRSRIGIFTSPVTPSA